MKILPFAILTASMLTSFSVMADSPRISGHISTGDETVIFIPGLEESVDIWHITDSHITVEQDDTLHSRYYARMAGAYENGTHHSTGQPVSREGAFSDIMRKASELRPDILALTGDILNYPSVKGVDFVQRELTGTGVPYLYTAGNHDWHLESMAGSPHGLREQWRNEILLPLYQGQNPSYTSYIIKGVNFVAIDNSTYQITPDQLEFYRAQKQKGLPIVLLVHIPIYVDNQSGFDESMGHPLWGAEVDNLYELEGRERWPAGGNNRETLELVREIYTTGAVVVLSGHTHIARTDSVGGMLQLTNKASRDASFRVIKLRPA